MRALVWASLARALESLGLLVLGVLRLLALVALAPWDY